jgi:tRNA(fMet)-specific endonuclease VapC
MTARLRVPDTDTLSLVQRRQQPYVQRLLALPPDQRAITIVSVEEQLRGWLARLRKAKDTVALIGAYAHLYEAIVYLTQTNILLFDDQAAGYMNRLRQQRIRIGTLDLRMAAIVLSVDGILVTRNWTDFQQIPGLAMEDWS